MKINHIAAATMFSSLMLLSACSWFQSTPTPTPTPTAAPAPIASDSRDSSQSSASIRDVQTQLSHQGFYHGPIDGVWGPTTSNALRGYQQKNHLAATGKLDDPTMLLLHDNSNAPSL